MSTQAESCDDDGLGFGSKPTPETDLEHLSTVPASPVASNPILRAVVVKSQILSY